MRPRIRNCMVAYMSNPKRNAERGAGGEPGADAEPISVARSVDLPADPAAVWHAVADPHERTHWLDDPDAVGRCIHIDESHPEQRLVWTWWSPDDRSDTSTVDLRLTRTPDGTRLTVVETRRVPAPPGTGPIEASAGVDSVRRAAPDLWSSRLLGLELRLVLAGVPAR